MEASRLDRVRIDVAGNFVEITWDERDTLLGKLRVLAGCETIVQNFAEAVGASRPVELDDEQRSRLRLDAQRSTRALSTRKPSPLPLRTHAHHGSTVDPFA